MFGGRSGADDGKVREFAIARRIRESRVMYIAIPGIYRIRLAVDSCHNPRRPSEVTIPLATHITDTCFGTLDNLSWLDVAPDLH